MENIKFICNIQLTSPVLYPKSYVFRDKLDKSGQTCQNCHVTNTLPNVFDKKFCSVFHDTRPVLIMIKISFSMTACGEVQTQVRAVTLTARATRSHWIDQAVAADTPKVKCTSESKRRQGIIRRRRAKGNTHLSTATMRTAVSIATSSYEHKAQSLSLKHKRLVRQIYCCCSSALCPITAFVSSTEEVNCTIKANGI
jgi:hypothetical protein